MFVIISKIDKFNKINNNTCKSAPSIQNFTKIISSAEHCINGYFHKLNSNKYTKYIINSPSYSITNNVITIKILYYKASKKINNKRSTINKFLNQKINNHNKNIEKLCNRFNVCSPVYKYNKPLFLIKKKAKKSRFFKKTYTYTKVNQSNNNIINKHLLLSSLISSIVKIKVNIEITRIYYPYIDSIIFAKYLSHNSNTSNYLKYQDQIQKNIKIISNKLLSNITAIKVIISGRITTQAVIPRITKKSFSYGTFKGNDVEIDHKKYTTQNRHGAFTFKVWIGQKKKIINIKLFYFT